MKENLNKLHDKLYLMNKEQQARFMLYFPKKVHYGERTIALLVAFMQLCMIISFATNIERVLQSTRSSSYFFLYIFLFIISCSSVVWVNFAIKRENYKLFVWVRRLYGALLCLWVIGITFLENAGGHGITVFCYFLPCAAAVMLLFPAESLCIFGTTWAIMICMFWHLSGGGPLFFSSFVNVTFVTLLAIFISYRYYQSMAKEFCDREIINKQYDEIQKKNVQLHQMLHLDQLTSLYNRRYLQENIYEQYENAKKSNYKFLIMMIDIDYFKKYNDTYGHLQGDDCLKRVASVLRDVAKNHSASAIRYGGEEFMVAKLGLDLPDPQAIAQEMQQAFCAANIQRSDTAEKRLTVSIGLWNGEVTSVDNIEEAIRRSDQALYKAKDLGRNRAVQYTADLDA